MLSFEERMALLEAALAEHTPQSLMEKLNEYPAYGPSLASYVVEVSERVRVIEPCNAEAGSCTDVTFSDSAEYGEAA